MATPKTFRHVRCTLCGVVLAGWLPIPNRPEASMLLYHLGANHLAEAKPYLAGDIKGRGEARSSLLESLQV
jgi:hypothetical protein